MRRFQQPMQTQPLQPYPGLRFYRPDQEDIFAGRDTEADECTQIILSSTITILHGVTGCGKSSFLRAGVKPLIELSDVGVRFEAQGGEKGRFQVIRSTALPLRAFAAKLFSIVDSLAKSGRSSFGNLRNGVDRKGFAARFADPEARIRAAGYADAAYKVLNELTEAMETAPIFVIDQAEEVFTLTDAFDPDGAALSGREHQRQKAQYFRLLKRVANEANNVRFVISLRTEYKGRFDDEIAQDGHPGSRLTGYYLEELQEKGLVAAVERPTQLGYGFKFEDGVARMLAEDLLEPGEVPAGGILPALQVACLRLWKQARENAAGSEGEGFVIRVAQLRRLGAVKLQIEEYLSESLEDACSLVEDWRPELSTVIDAWHRIIENSLVTKLADGRAVTKSQAESALVEKAQEMLGVRKATKEEIRRVLAFLARDDVGILKTEIEAGSIRWSLGHDSIALALDKWKTAFGGTAVPTMRMIASSVPAYTLNIDDLFAESEMPETPTVIFVPEDYNWDRQIPIFASRFARRLGFEFKTVLSLSALTPVARGGPTNWSVLRDRIAALQEQTEEARRPGGVDERVLVVAEWDEFPGEPDDSGFDRASQAPNWCDLLVSDMYLGSALIGPELELEFRLSDRELAADKAEAVRDQLKDTFKALMKRQATFLCADKSGIEFLQVAARLADSEDFAAYLDQPDVLNTMKGSDYMAGDPSVAWLTQEGGDNPEENGRRFIVASAFGRALAVQAGYSVHFGAKHVALLAQDELSERRISKRRAKLSRGTDLAADVQRIVSHTLWQVSVPPALWRQGLNRALVLRLASVGYFSVEHLRTNMDRFVMHIHAWANSILENGEEQGEGVRGTRLYRGIVRETITDCFEFLRFDEYSERRYDLDSPFAYFSDHQALQSRSVAGEIYNELSALRQATIGHFQGISHAISWLRSRKTTDGASSYDPTDYDIARAYRLKELAWNNFRVLNFYDAERYMRAAADKFARKVEEVGHV